MARWMLTIAVAVLYVLHQDTWFWDTARPLVFGFLPIGLFYHAAYSVAVAVLMVLLIQYAWPRQLERDAESTDTSPPARSSRPRRAS
jgi:hypothetical protein